jgi:putative addiction module killer protein
VRVVVREYLTTAGENPFRGWLKSLGTKSRARVQARVLRFELGNLGDHKSVGAGVWEARLDFGPGYRDYFGRNGPIVLVLLCGGDKSTQAKDVARAKTYWRRYLEARNHDEA